MRVRPHSSVLPFLKKPKFGNIKTEIDGFHFASKKEAQRYSDLRTLEKGGFISELKLQPKYLLSVNDYKVCEYWADFSYMENGKRVVEDVKSSATRKLSTYRIKIKLMKAIYGIEVREV